ncbi:ornithinee aminotransferase [Rothia sp. HMSC071C12]|uniref:ornithinee aminotransferase n=1 Tax=Rothia sp. HMSC071C12 TaxID=1739446 RepID=UPI0008A24841|nr:ornithinee aminotransferase [Rothia sp. HMSC071C12]OFQ37408.1 ornithinee aminotransferase [Rothia sp. HMSC071C12]
MSFFGIGKKKLDEQSREEQSAETAKVQKEQVSEDAPKNARLSQKIMEQQQWEDSLRRFVKSESARQQNHDEEQNEEHRAVEDLKRALLHGDEKVEESSATDELTEDQAEEQERRSLLAALGAFPQESEEPVEAEQVAQAQDVEEDDAPVAEAAQPATPAFLRDDEESADEDASVEVQEPKDAAEDARSQFEEHLRAVRAQNTEEAAAENTAAEDAEADADTADEAEGREELEVAEAVVEASENKSENAHSASEAEEIHTVEDMKAARTHAAVTEAQNAGLDDLAAAYAARLGITLDSEEETFVEVASDEAIAEETAADKATTEAPEPAEATESVEDTDVSEVSATVAETAEDFESEETVDLTAGEEEVVEPATATEEEPIEAVVEAPELLASELTEEENAVSDETELLSAVSVEEKHDVSVSEAPAAKDFDAEEENTAELIFDASAVAAPVVAAAAVASTAKTEKAEKAEEKTEKGTSQSVALTAEGIDKKEAEKHESAARDDSTEEPVAELKETEQKLSEDEAELVAESIILSEPVEGAATLPALPEQRALHGLAELMRTRGSGTMSLELRQVDEDMHYRLLHRGREVETGIVVPGVDWFAPVAALYTEAQQVGATWNRAAVSLKPRLGDGLEVHASYLGAVDGQTISESFLLEGAAVEAKPVATAEAAEATSQDEPQEAAVQSVDPVEAELAEKQAANEAEAAAEAAEEPVVETAEEGASAGLLTAAGLAAAGTAVAGSAASAQEKEDVEEAVEASAQPAAQPAQAEFAPVEAEFEHDYENDPVFGAATVEPETEHAEESAAEVVEASAEDSVEPGEDMEAALATIVANAQKKLDAEEATAPAVAEEAPAEEVSAEEVLAAEEQKAAAPVVAESFTLDRTQPVEEAADEPIAESSEEPALPAFLDDSELLPEKETSAASAEAPAEEPALVDVEPAAESASVAPGLAGALAAAAAVGTAGAATKAAEAKASEAKATGAQEEPAEKAAELKTVEVAPAAKIAEAPVAVAPASEATDQTAPAAPAAEVAEAAPASEATTPVALPESTPAGISSSISASALSELNQLPTIVAEPDTPSAAVQSPLVPSETQLAAGNLVLTEAQVAQRLAPVVEHLFGENGTAKDATTVLIRVRALGSYYDALTHVRRNGFWEQVRTFELIPETLLDIPALKTDSYSEGEGSPLAMSLTFTPGVPVQAAFDYANEQAFVTYPRPLDAERYVEELRMFPRLGSKIPAHMTSALSHWNL